ncbi:ComEC/Rec2 family competence protein [Microbacterium betulae]|uniref:ComEC/Rec2 family competence protein n=1 Tax=Microbacterium betulae TaxID=2981139 RepID=A0AA97FNJ2_9MICO|nr:ComEC/Rec2 family competence protein [Microbacterium sp. AB]WOF24652.1 ComEC/Rec2 family competence protein [Microbacterium sp. AB]
MTGATRRDLRLLPGAVGAWGAAFVSVMLPVAASGVAIALWSVLLASLGWMRVRRSTGGVALLAVAAAASAVTATHAAFVHPERDAVREASVGEGRHVEMTASLSTKVRQVGDRLWFEADVVSLRAGGRSTESRVPVTIAIEPADLGGRDAVDLGAHVEVRGTARAADAGDRPVIVVFADGGEVVRPPPHVLGTMSALRDGFVTEVVAGLPEPGAGLLPGLAVGDTRAVSDELDHAMKASSLTHLTAVSGANCAIVVGLVFGLAALLRVPRAGRAALALLALGGFVLLVTPEPSVVRAATMAVIAMLALLRGRTGAGVAVLSGACIVLLAMDPWLATSYGFVLSVVATGALLLLAGPLAAGLSRWMPRAIALAVSVPLAAQIACAPIIVLLSPEVSVYGVVANMIAAPAAPVATVIGMLACVVQGIPFLAAGLAGVAWAPSAWIAQTAFLFAGLPAASLPWWGGLPGVTALTVVGACAAVVVVRPRPGGAARRLRRASAAVLAATVGAAAGSAALGGIAGPLTVPSGWTVAMCDVGQGDAVVLRSGEATALVDTGPDPDRLDACLSRLGVGGIDLLVVTHFDLDHVGGIQAVAGRVGTVLHGPLGTDDVGWLERAGDARRIDAALGLTGTLGDAEWRVLWPRADSRAFPEGNDASVVVEVSGGDLPRTLLLGDLSASAQSALLATGAVAGRYDVVKVSHHGSADQQPALYRSARPALALIGVGADNGYGHPADSILAELGSLGATVARTDADGLVLAGDSDGELWVWRAHEAADEPREEEPASTAAAGPRRGRRGARGSVVHRRSSARPGPDPPPDATGSRRRTGAAGRTPSPAARAGRPAGRTPRRRRRARSRCRS